MKRDLLLTSAALAVLVAWVSLVVVFLHYLAPPRMTMFGPVSIPLPWTNSFPEFNRYAIGGLLLNCALPALVEEAAFRWAPYQIAKEFSKSLVIPVLIIFTFFFAIGHNSPEPILIQGAVGATSCYLMLKTDKYWPSVVLHFFYNAIVIFSPF